MENSIYGNHDYRKPIFFTEGEEKNKEEEPKDPKPTTQGSTVIIKPVKSPNKNPNHNN